MLTELWQIVPDPVVRFIGRRWQITAAAAHDWLCPALGCRCAALAETCAPTAA